MNKARFEFFFILLILIASQMMVQTEGRSYRKPFFFLFTTTYKKFIKFPHIFINSNFISLQNLKSTFNRKDWSHVNHQLQFVTAPDLFFTSIENQTKNGVLSLLS
ncbi:hypothetical protein P8452_23184 [Trifolium repens]|nr:hypothetical protein P8452_23184 [Trifolium repens]